MKEDLNVELTDYTLKRVEKFSPKFKEFARIRNDAVLGVSRFAGTWNGGME